MKLSTYIQEKRPKLERHIKDYLLQKKRDSAQLPFLNELIEKLEIFVTKGKLLRGLFVLMAYEACSKKRYTDHVLDAATGLEITHSALLIHDDIMDNDMKRRGEPTIFAQYAQKAQDSQYSQPLFYGQTMGICAGDVGFFLGYELFARSADKVQTLNRILTLYAKELYSVGDAQMADVHYSLTTEEPKEETIMNIYRYKTGRYTFSLPLMIGGLQAGADEKLLKELNDAGELLGIVFQMVDDIIGLVGDEEEIGKPKGSDIRENKKTLVRHLLLKKVSPVEKEKLAQIFGHSSLTRVEVDFVAELVKKYGVATSLLNEAKEMTLKAQNTILGMSIDQEYKELLNAVAEYNLSRVR